MNTVLLILQKDFKRYAWALITLAVLSLLQVYLFGTSAGMHETKLNAALGFFSGTIRSILFFFLIVMVVQEETLSDPDAYWLARPLNRLHVLASKICFLLVVLGIGGLAEALILILNDGATRIGYSLATTILLGLAIWQWQIFLAAQTRSLPRYLLLLVGFVVGFYALMAFMTFFIADLDIENMGQLPSEIPDHFLAIIQILLWITAGTAALIVYYLKRQKRYAWACLLPTLLIAVILTPRDTILGADINFTDDDRYELELLDLRKSGTMHTNGKEYVTVTGVFRALDTDQDVWVTPSYVRISTPVEEINLDAYDSCQSLEPTTHKGHEAMELRLFSMERNSLNDLTDDFDITIRYNLSTSTQREAARLPVEAGSAFTHNGNRIILQDFYTSDSKLSINIESYLPDFVLEPKAPTPQNEPLNGKYSMAVYNRRDNTILEIRVNGSWSGWGTKTGARIELPHTDEKSLDDLEIIFFARDIEKTSWGYHDASGMRINLN
ncbi:MAG: hypothetical protein GVY36_11195 [Verrucomicrobia bacterium]|jgi:ABC-type transport system involved in multi-copper enzyme maturation permease subunit|nr:hypothetical protein [Verrucomicrobiota bacterium]